MLSRLKDRSYSHQRHHIVEQSIAVSRIEERQDVRMLQFRGGSDLSQKPLAAQRRAQFGVQHFDGDAAVVIEIVREIDSRHPAGAELAFDAIPPASAEESSAIMECVSNLAW